MKMKANLKQVIGLVSFMSFFTGLPVDAAESRTVRSDSKPFRVRAPFIKNEGQIDESVRFYVQIGRGKVAVLNNGSIFYSIVKRDSGKRYCGAFFEEYFVAGKRTSVRGLERAHPRTAKLGGGMKWLHSRAVPSFNSLDLGEIYPNIRVTLRSYENNVGKLFHIAPGGDVNASRMGVRGIQEIRLNRCGELELVSKHGRMSLAKPIAYQMKDRLREAVSVSYRIDGASYRFNVGPYDRNRELVIASLIASTHVD